MTNDFAPIRRILLDLDDVLNNFTMCAMKYLGCDIDIEEYPNEVGYDIIAAVNLMHPTNCYWTAEQVWGILGVDFWDRMAISDIFYTVLEHSADIVGEDQVFVCSSLTTNHHCTAGKLKWMDKNLPHWLQGRFVLTPYKSLLADSQTLLIDDCQRNTVSFEKSGGRVLLVPRPWNPHHRYDTKSFTAGALDIWKSNQK